MHPTLGLVGVLHPYDGRVAIAFHEVDAALDGDDVIATLEMSGRRGLARRLRAHRTWGPEVQPVVQPHAPGRTARGWPSAPAVMIQSLRDRSMPAVTWFHGRSPFWVVGTPYPGMHG